MYCFILGAGSPYKGVVPSSLIQLNRRQSVLDWQMDAFSVLDNPQICFLGGYHIEDVMAQYPNLNYVAIADWEKKTPVHTLCQAPWQDEESVVCYADTLFRKELLQKLCETPGDVIYVFDRTHSLNTYSDDEESQFEFLHVNDCGLIDPEGTKVEFTGLVKYTQKAIHYVRHLQASDVGTSIPDLLNLMMAQGLQVIGIDGTGLWTELNHQHDIAKFVLGTKSETLMRLSSVLQKGLICDQIQCTVKQWNKDSSSVLNNIRNKFPNQSLIVRSSAVSEDGWSSSNAGGYHSVLGVDSEDRIMLESAIGAVLASYGTSRAQDQILIQPQVQNVVLSGVVFTCMLETGASYYRINFDDQSSSTQSVTSGGQHELRTMIVYRTSIDLLKDNNPSIYKVLQVVEEVAQRLHYDKLDIEFAMNQSGDIYILQVRPITVDHYDFDITEERLLSQIRAACNQFHRVQKKTPAIVGDYTIFGVMPDWNPAEIIGVRPTPLAMSLYDYLITGDVWAKQRAMFGYRDVRPCSLMIAFCGQPYIDIRASLNSFIPSTVPDEDAEVLVNAYLKNLQTHPELHDKIEFDVAITVWTPNFQKLADRLLRPYGVTEIQVNRLEDALKKLTKRAFKRLSDDIQDIDLLEARLNSVEKSELDPLDQACMLLSECRSLGTLPFAHAARAGFIASSWLKSLLSMGIISQTQYDLFFSDIDTVSGAFENDFNDLKKGLCSLKTFMEKYGHLRPGTYDITVESYQENPDKYFLGFKQSQTNISEKVCDTEKIIFDVQTLREVDILLKRHGMDMTSDDFFSYCSDAIIAREQLKFVFTKCLSRAFDAFILYGDAEGISRDALSFLTFDDLSNLRKGVHTFTAIPSLVSMRRDLYKVTKMVELPLLLCQEADFYCFERPKVVPNFITMQQASGNVVVYHENMTYDLEGAVILIPQADPGFDWLFQYPIAGLITQYGGANSHMAIRSAEKSLPAAIGVGGSWYEMLRDVKHIHLDCAKRLIHHE